MSSVFTVQLSSQHSAIQHVTNIVNTIIELYNVRVLFVLSVTSLRVVYDYETTTIQQHELRLLLGVGTFMSFKPV